MLKQANRPTADPLVGFRVNGGRGGWFHWQKGDAVGSKPLKTSFSEALSCSVVAVSDCTGLLPPKGLLVPPGLDACFTTPNREDTGRL